MAETSGIRRQLTCSTFEDTFGTDLLIRTREEAIMSTITAVYTSVRPTLRITRRGRVVLGAVLALPVAAVLVSMAVNSIPAAASSASSAAVSSGAASSEFDFVTVGEGESLWSVAERVAPASDPRDVIADIERLNGLESSVVAAGQSLAIPAAYTD
jgi:hypothetical protein